MEVKNEFDSKLVLLGNSGVGKTSLVLREVQGTFISNQSSTIGASFMTKRMLLDDWKVKLQIWDTAGQERFRSMTPMYYRGADAAILVYDITSEETFENVKDWVKELNANIRNDIVIAIAGNKADLEEQRKVTLEKAQSYASSIDAILHETSAKNNMGIDALFNDITERLIRLYKAKKKEAQSSAPFPNDSNNNEKKKCCG